MKELQEKHGSRFKSIVDEKQATRKGLPASMKMTPSLRSHLAMHQLKNLAVP